MAGSSQPQHFFAAGCVFDDFAIDVIFYTVVEIFCIIEYLGGSKIQFCKYDKNFLKIR